MPEFVAQLPADEIIWGAFKVVGIDVKGASVSRRPKYILVKYMPEGIPTIKKARSGNHKGAIKEVMAGVHLDMEVMHYLFLLLASLPSPFFSYALTSAPSLRTIALCRSTMRPTLRRQ